MIVARTVKGKGVSLLREQGLLPWRAPPATRNCRGLWSALGLLRQVLKTAICRRQDLCGVALLCPGLPSALMRRLTYI